MHDIETIQRKHERLKAFPPDLRIRQVRRSAALEMSRAKNYVLNSFTY